MKSKGLDGLYGIWQQVLLVWMSIKESGWRCSGQFVPSMFLLLLVLFCDPWVIYQNAPLFLINSIYYVRIGDDIWNVLQHWVNRLVVKKTPMATPFASRIAIPALCALQFGVTAPSEVWAVKTPSNPRRSPFRAGKVSGPGRIIAVKWRKEIRSSVVCFRFSQIQAGPSWFKDSMIELAFVDLYDFCSRIDLTWLHDWFRSQTQTRTYPIHLTRLSTNSCGSFNTRST